jgi:aldehyde:ferredoxin oxidoreductase
MGSKNLKAIAVSGDPSRTPILKDRPRVMELLKQVNQTYADDEFINTVMTPLGTRWGVWYNQSRGRLPTRNFEEGVFEGADRIDHRNMSELKMFKASEGCYACRVRCKRAVELDDGRMVIERRYGGAEYESLGNLGPLLGIDNLVAIEKANELCARFTIDTISCGATLAWAFDCFEKGILTADDTGGLELRWGDADVALKLIDMIAHREGFGDVLAEGTRRASAGFGAPAEALAAHNKGLEWPAGDPRVEPAQALAYAVCPIGADHMTRGGEDLGPGFWELAMPPREDGFSGALVRSYYLQRTLGSVIDGFGICHFLVGATGLNRTVDLAEAATGWSMSIWEMMRAGDRRITMFRAYNAREGFTIEADTMPARAFKPIKGGPEDGSSVDPDAHARAVHDYYLLSGWEPETGWPTRGKLLELGLELMVGEGPPPLAAGDGQVLEKADQQNTQERREG